jgi:DNA-binding CsgD family transcriptional regulator
MGKSQLLARLSAICAEGNRPVYTWTGHSLEQGQAYGALEDLCDSLGIARTGNDRSVRHNIVDKLSAERAFLLVDDAHWFDSESLRVLVGVAERAGEKGIGLVVAHRPVQDNPEIAALDAVLSRSQPIMQLSPLTHQEVAERVGGILGCPVEQAAVDALMVRTEGVSLYVDRLMQAWVEAGVIERGRLMRDPGILPPVAAQIVVTKLAQLEPAARLIVTGLTVGTSLDDELLGALFGLSVNELRTTVTALRAAGLLSPSRPVLLPLVGEAVDALTPLLTQRDLHFRLARILVQRGAQVSLIAEHLVAAEAKGSEVAALLVQAGDQALFDAPEMAADWYSEAVTAGAEATALGARRAEAAAMSGALDEALGRADQVIGDSDAPERQRALAVLAAVLPSRGLWRRSADIYDSLATSGGVVTPQEAACYAVAGLVAAGEGGLAAAKWREAEGALGGATPLVTVVAGLVARGCLESVGFEPRAAIGSFLEAAELLEAGQRNALMPDTPHALGALTAIAALDFPVAEHLLERAIATSAGGAAFAARHRLLLGWVGLRTGRWAMAEAALEKAARSTPELCLRDQLAAAAMEVGIARRAGDHEQLNRAWARASGVLRRHPADLFSGEFIGELACSASGVGGDSLAESKVAELEEVCLGLGHPALWVLPLRWSRLQAAVAAGDEAGAGLAAKALAEVAPVSAGAGCVQPAGIAWSQSLAGRIDPEGIRNAAAELQRVGLGWEASRLAGSAASRSSDPALSRSLLERARELNASLPTLERGVVPSFTALSERERQVAALVVGGLTHKEIGAQLFISPKTVEHHVAKIRQRVGATSRAELLSELRTLLSVAR